MLKIITISREYGSGGRQIGAMLAEKLNIPFYDKQLFAEASKRSGIHEDFLEKAEENGSRMYTHAFDFPWSGVNMPLNDRIFLAQANTIQELAEQGPCVIVGRGGNQILKKRQDTLHVFIHADFEKRVRRIVEEYGVEASKAEKMIQTVDKNRASYLKAYTNQNFGEAANYHLCINSGTIGIDNAVEMIYAVYQESTKKDF